MNSKEEVNKKAFKCLKCKKEEVKTIKAKAPNVVRCIKCGGLMSESTEKTPPLSFTTTTLSSKTKSKSTLTNKITNKAIEPKAPKSLIRLNNHSLPLNQQPIQNRRDRSLDFLPKSLGMQLRNPRQNPLGFLQDFFAGYGVDFPAEELMQETGIRPRPQRQPQLSLQVNQQRVSSDIYDPQFNTLGSSFNDTFLQNFSSNFRSNFEENVFNQLLSLIQGNRVIASQEKHPPTKRSVLMALKKFPLTDKYCKTNQNGQIELPNCCICINDIKKEENTVLLPCGHLLHWKCAFAWLKQNNTCPVCRFELPS